MSIVQTTFNLKLGRVPVDITHDDNSCSECIVCIHVARLYLCLVLGLGPGVGRGVLTWLMSSMLARGALTLLSQPAIMPARLVLLMMMNLSGFQVVQQRSVVGVEHVYWHS